MIVYFYTKENCSLCEEAYALLTMFQRDYNFSIEKRDIYKNDEWLEEFQLLIPAIEVKDKLLTCKGMQYDKIEQLLKTAMNVDG